MDRFLDFMSLLQEMHVNAEIGLESEPLHFEDRDHHRREPGLEAIEKRERKASFGDEGL